jgi:thioredoxin-like negative regulator of GroEL
MQPIVDGLETEFAGQLAFERRDANTESGKAVMDAYGLRAHPSYVIVAPDGAALWSFAGQLPADALQEQVRKYAKASP